MRKALVVVWLLAVGCGSDGQASIVPDTQGFDVDPEVEQEIEDAARTGDGAEGGYVFDEAGETITLTFESSTFDCQIEANVPLVATVTELTATTMTWEFADGGTAMWMRLDNGTSGIQGIWKTEAPTFYLVLDAEGGAQIFGSELVCNDERRRNGNSCYQVTPASIAVSLDGDASEWDGVDPLAQLADDAGDHQGSDPGADLKGLRVAVSQGKLYVFTELASAPSTEFQGRQAPNGGSYRLTVQDSSGLSYQDRLAYSPESESWGLQVGLSGIEAAVTATGIEWSVSVSLSVDEVSLILIEPVDCSVGCTVLDEMPCGFFSP